MPRDYSHTASGSQVHFGFGFIFDKMFTETYAIGTGVNVFYLGGLVEYFEMNEGAPSVIESVSMTSRLQYVEIPLTFKMRTKEIGYTTYFGRFGVGLGLNVRTEGTKESQGIYQLSQGSDPEIWEPLEPPGDLQTSNAILSNHIRLFRPAMIIGLGGERRFTGTTALTYGISYNMGIRTQYIDMPVLEVDSDGGVLFDNPEIDMSGKSAFFEFCVGLMF